VIGVEKMLSTERGPGDDVPVAADKSERQEVLLVDCRAGAIACG
jgi:hypothetical protein